MGLTLRDFVKFVLLRLHKDGHNLPIRDDEQLHALLYELKRSDISGKPEFIKDLWFDWDGPCPKCPYLSEFLDSLGVMGLITTTSPRHEKFRLYETIVETWSREYDELPEETKRFIDTALVIFHDEL